MCPKGIPNEKTAFFTFSFKLKVIQFAEQKGKHAATKLFKMWQQRAMKKKDLLLRSLLML
jgi:hypothetical protein